MAQDEIIDIGRPGIRQDKPADTGRPIDVSGQIIDVGHEPDLPPAASDEEIAKSRWREQGGWLGFGKRALNKTFVEPIRQHPGSFIGGIAGGVVGVPALEGPGYGPLLYGIATGIGGAAGQNVEDLIRMLAPGGKDPTYAESLENQAYAFLENFAAAGGTLLATKLAQRLAQAGVKGAARWLLTREVPAAVQSARMAEGSMPMLSAHGVRESGAVVPRGSVKELGKVAERVNRGGPGFQPSNEELWRIQVQDLVPEIPGVPGEQYPIPRPSTPGKLHAGATEAGRIAQVKAAAQREADVRATSTARRGAYESMYEEPVIKHKNNRWKAGTLTLREVKKGKKVIKVKNPVPYESPVPVRDFINDNETAIYHLTKRGTYTPPPASPAGKLLKALRDGDNYVQFDDLKKAVAQVRRSNAVKPGQPMTTAQGDALRWAGEMDSWLDSMYKKLAERAKQDPDLALGEKELADLFSVKEHEALGGPGGEMTKAEQRAQVMLQQSKKANLPEPPPVTGRAFPPTRVPYAPTLAETGEKVAKFSAGIRKDVPYLRKLVSGENGGTRVAELLDATEARGVSRKEAAKEILQTVIDQMQKGALEPRKGGLANWDFWPQMMQSGAAEELATTAGIDIHSLTPVFESLDTLQKAGMLGQKELSGIAKFIRLVGHLGPTHVKRAAAWRLADIVESPATARRLNMYLRGMRGASPVGFPIRRTLGAVETVIQPRGPEEETPYPNQPPR